MINSTNCATCTIIIVIAIFFVALVAIMFFQFVDYRDGLAVGKALLFENVVLIVLTSLSVMFTMVTLIIVVIGLDIYARMEKRLDDVRTGEEGLDDEKIQSGRISTNDSKKGN